MKLKAKKTQVGYYITDEENNLVATVAGEHGSELPKAMAAAPDLLAALEDTVIPLTRLGDFIGNEDKGGASGLGPFNRCDILLAVKRAIAKAKGESA